MKHDLSYYFGQIIALLLAVLFIALVLCGVALLLGLIVLALIWTWHQIGCVVSWL